MASQIHRIARDYPAPHYDAHPDAHRGVGTPSSNIMESSEEADNTGYGGAFAAIECDSEESTESVDSRFHGTVGSVEGAEETPTYLILAHL